MGLEVVEIVMEAEDRFGVSLPDAELEHVRTVADLSALIWSRLPRSSGVCPTMHEFFEIRRKVVATTRLDRRTVRPTTRIADLFPTHLRRSWKRLRKLDRRVPQLVASPRADAVMLWVSGISVFLYITTFGTMWGAHGVSSLVFSIPILFLWLAGLSIASTRLAMHLPLGIETIGDLARAVAPLDTRGMNVSAGSRLLSQIRVLEETRTLVARNLALSLERVRPESDFIKDLGCG
ncbi:MAG: phosphopantetheine-binding protein [Phycisphaerales bacterium]